MFLPALPFLSLVRVFNCILWSLLHFLHFIHLLVFVLVIRRISANQVLNGLFYAIDMRLHVFCYEVFVDLLMRRTALDFSV